MTINCFGSHNSYPNTNRNKIFHIVGHVLVGLLFAVAFALVFALLVKLIWNGLMPTIFDLQEITFWQAFGIIILAKLLFGSFGSRYHDRWKKEERHIHFRQRPTDHTDDETPPSHHSRDWKTYTQYWQEEGKAAFEAYMGKIKSE